MAQALPQDENPDKAKTSYSLRPPETCLQIITSFVGPTQGDERCAMFKAWPCLEILSRILEGQSHEGAHTRISWRLMHLHGTAPLVSRRYVQSSRHVLLHAMRALCHSRWDVTEALNVEPPDPTRGWSLMPPSTIDRPLQVTSRMVQVSLQAFSAMDKYHNVLRRYFNRVSSFIRDHSLFQPIRTFCQKEDQQMLSSA